MEAAAQAASASAINLLPSAGTGPVRTVAMTVSEYGRVVLMDGVGMGRSDGLFRPPYLWILRNGITGAPLSACWRELGRPRARVLSAACTCKRRRSGQGR